MLYILVPTFLKEEVNFLLRLKPGGRRSEKTKLGETDSRCLLWITAQSSALVARKKRIRRVSGVGEILLVNG